MGIVWTAVGCVPHLFVYFDTFEVEKDFGSDFSLKYINTCNLLIYFCATKCVQIQARDVNGGTPLSLSLSSFPQFGGK